MQLFVEFNDQHSADIAIRSRARLHRAGGDATVPGAVAAALGVAVAEVAALFAAAGEEGA